MTAPRVCVVTGAGRGIGRATALALLADGHRVVAVARGAESLESLAADAGPDASGRALAVPADVTVADDVERIFAAAEERWGPAEVLVAAAGTGSAARLDETSDALWDGAIALNLTAPFRCMRRALPGMRAAGWGRIVVVGSVVSKRGEPLVAAYTASKHGVLGLVRSAAAELARTGITVNAVCPGYVDTPMTAQTVADIGVRSGRTPDEARAVLAGRQPIGRLIAPDEVADAVRFCIGNAAMTGQGLNIDGGAVQS
ncbi:SDR family NAD(P)-dependent oxidoreductase [Tomitella gaofuii]|uniref:SDR family NAD(P)-dependent oxidoreductase n=1 Tax=Tomitella gaofuii TaxID=2760083 RepID=UPI0015FA3FC9|nr:SDR family oxidoreductase [Tomitella gaofuii]